MKSGLSRPTAENADLRPFHIASRSAGVLRDADVVGAGRADQRFEIDELRVDVGGLALELDQQDRRRVEGIAGVDGGFRRLDRQVVHDLHGPGQQPGADDARHRVAGGLERVIGGEHGAEAGRPRQQPQRDLERDPEAAFGADEAADEVGPDRIEAAAAERHQRPVGEHRLEPEDVVQRHAVAEAVGAARVEGDVAADRADRLARRIGRVVHAERDGGGRDVEVDDAGLDDGDAIDRIDLQDARQPVQRDDDAVDVRHGPAGQAGAAAAGHERHPGFRAEPDDGDDLVARLRQHDGAGTGAKRGEPVGLERGQAGRGGDDARGRQHAGDRRQQLGRAHGRYGSRSRMGPCAPPRLPCSSPPRPSWPAPPARRRRTGTAPPTGQTPVETGFTALFNGRDLDGWTGAVDGYEVKDGAIVCKAGQGGTLFTRGRYRNFVVRLEFKLPPAGNNGLAIRYPGSGDSAYVGMTELQVLDDTAPRDHRRHPDRRPDRPSGRPVDAGQRERHPRRCCPGSAVRLTDSAVDTSPAESVRGESPHWQNARVTHLAITVLGHDRPGIIAQAADALADSGMNLEDSSMTLLRGHFAMTLICAGSASVAEVERALEPLADGSLTVDVRELPRAGQQRAATGEHPPGDGARCRPTRHRRPARRRRRRRRRATSPI